MIWIGCLRCEQFRRDFAARTFAFVTPIRLDLHRVSRSNVPNAPKHYQMHQNMSLGFNDMDRLRCEKFQRDFVARTFTLIALVRHVLHRVSWIHEMFPNALKHYETHQKMSLGFNDMDRVPSLRKIPTRVRCTNFYINCTSSASFASSFVE